jgi:Spy/CpxP family protein refolding chaperone
VKRQCCKGGSPVFSAVVVGFAIVMAVTVMLAVVRAGESSPPPMPDQPLSDMTLAFDGPFGQCLDAPMAGAPGPGRPDRPEMERQRRHLEQLRLLKLLEVLDLKDSQEEPFLVAFQAIRKSLRDLDEQKGRLLARLSEIVQSSARDDRKISALTDSVVSISDQKRSAAKVFFVKARGILSAEQTAKLLIFEERFEYELLERVREFRRMGRLDGPMRNQIDSNEKP